MTCSQLDFVVVVDHLKTNPLVDRVKSISYTGRDKQLMFVLRVRASALNTSERNGASVYFWESVSSVDSIADFNGFYLLLSHRATRVWCTQEQKKKKLIKCTKLHTVKINKQQ